MSGQQRRLGRAERAAGGRQRLGRAVESPHESDPVVGRRAGDDTVEKVGVALHRHQCLTPTIGATLEVGRGRWRSISRRHRLERGRHHRWHRQTAEELGGKGVCQRKVRRQPTALMPGIAGNRRVPLGERWQWSCLTARCKPAVQSPRVASRCRPSHHRPTTAARRWPARRVVQRGSSASCSLQASCLNPGLVSAWPLAINSSLASQGTTGADDVGRFELRHSAHPDVGIRASDGLSVDAHSDGFRLKADPMAGTADTDVGRETTGNCCHADEPRCVSTVGGLSIELLRETHA